MITGTQKTLSDGRTVDSGSEEWRAECEARYVLGLHRIESAPFLAGVRQRRGEAAWNYLQANMNRLRHRRRCVL